MHKVHWKKLQLSYEKWEAQHLYVNWHKYANLSKSTPFQSSIATCIKYFDPVFSFFLAFFPALIGSDDWIQRCHGISIQLQRRVHSQKKIIILYEVSKLSKTYVVRTTCHVLVILWTDFVINLVEMASYVWLLFWHVMISNSLQITNVVVLPAKISAMKPDQWNDFKSHDWLNGHSDF